MLKADKLRTNEIVSVFHTRTHTHTRWQTEPAQLAGPPAHLSGPSVQVVEANSQRRKPKMGIQPSRLLLLERTNLRRIRRKRRPKRRWGSGRKLHRLGTYNSNKFWFECFSLVQRYSVLGRQTYDTSDGMPCFRWISIISMIMLGNTFDRKDIHKISSTRLRKISETSQRGNEKSMLHPTSRR